MNRYEMEPILNPAGRFVIYGDAMNAIEKLEARIGELEAWQKQVASGLGYLNQPEGQAGYEVASPGVIIRDWHEHHYRDDRYREALERIKDNAYSMLLAQAHTGTPEDAPEAVNARFNYAEANSALTGA